MPLWPFLPYCLLVQLRVPTITGAISRTILLTDTDMVMDTHQFAMPPRSATPPPFDTLAVATIRITGMRSSSIAIPVPIALPNIDPSTIRIAATVAPVSRSISVEGAIPDVSHRMQ